MEMKVKELLEIMEELDEDMEVNIAYQPHYPMTASANHLKVHNGIAYICENSYGENEYAPNALFDDNESDTEDLADGEE